MTTDPWMVAVSAAAAGGLVVVPRAWSVSRHVSTIVHEAGHAAVAFLTGRRLAGIRLHSDSSGVTVSVGRPRGPGMVAMLAAGYPASAALGIGAALMLRAGYVTALLWCLVGLLALMVVQIRNWFGAWSVLVSGVVVFAVTWWLPPRWQTGFAYLVTWFLLFAGPREVVSLYAARRRRGGRRGAQGSDADQLARLTGVPASVWVVGFFVVSLAVAVLGARLVL